MSKMGIRRATATQGYCKDKRESKCGVFRAVGLFLLLLIIILIY